MWKVEITNERKLQEFVSSIFHNQTLKYSPWKGLLRQGTATGRHHTFASVMLGVATVGVGVVLVYNYGSTISSVPLSEWLGICMSTQDTAADSLHCSPTMELRIPGLRNLGNNCFLNVVLQALASSFSFQSFIDSCIQISEKLPEEDAEFMPLAAAVSVLLEELSVLGAEGRVASPRRVMMAMEFYATNFDLARQQDAAEALGHLLSALKEECLIYIEQHMPLGGSLSSISAVCDNGFSNHKDRGEQISLESWNKYLQRPLDGTLGSVLTCQSCLFQSSTQFEFFHDLPLAPIVSIYGDIIEGCTIHDCLKKFTSSEHITTYRCSNCSHLSAVQALSLKFANEAIIQKIKDCNYDDKCSCQALVTEQGLCWPALYQNACKQLKIGRCPKVLCIHLQRASMNDLGELVKLRGHVSFPTVLDLLPYTLGGQEMKRRALLHEMQMQTQHSEYMLSHNEHLKHHFERNLLPCRPFLAKEFSCYAASMSGNYLEKNLCDTIDQSFQPQTSKLPNDEIYSTTEAVTSRNSNSHIKPDDGKSKIQSNCFGVQNGNTNDVYLVSRNMSSSFSEETDGNLLSSCFPSRVPCSKISDLQPRKNQNSKKATNDTGTAGFIGSRKSLCYELISVVQHNGSLGSGHYTVYRKVKVSKEPIEPVALYVTNKRDDSKQAVFVDQKEKTNCEDNACARTGVKNPSNCDVIWFRISDSDVERVTEEYVLGAYATLLFYERFEDAD